MTEILGQIRDPNFTFAVRDLGSFLLPVTGSLLGLVYAGLIYWFQGALEHLKYSRTFLEDILAAHGKVLLDFLVGASLLSLFAYFDLRLLASVTFWVFAAILTIDLLRVTAERGYFVTLFSEKSIPKGYGKFRAFLRKIRNAGPVHWWAAGAPLVLTVVYPIWVNSLSGFQWALSDNALSVTLLTTTGLSLLHIRSLLLEAIEARKAVAEQFESSDQRRLQNLEEPKAHWDGSKRTIERKILLERLSSIGMRMWTEVPGLVNTDNWDSTMITESVLMDLPVINDDGSCHINIFLPHFPSDAKTRDCIFEWSRRILEVFAGSKSSVSRYALSFFRNDGPLDVPHFAMIRATKSDVLANVGKNLSNRDFIKAMPGKFLSAGVT